MDGTDEDEARRRGAGRRFTLAAALIVLRLSWRSHMGKVLPAFIISRVFCLHLSDACARALARHPLAGWRLTLVF